MKKSMTVLTLSLAVIAANFVIQNAPASLDPESKIDASVKLAGSSVLVIMNEKADLTAARTLDTKLEKGRFVYEALTSTAERSQRDLRQWLSARGITHQSFYIINAVALDDATDSLMREIASRDDVRRLIGNPMIKNELPEGAITGRTANAPLGVAANITASGAPRVWKELGFSGKGIVVAGQDTGVDWDHPALLKQYRGYNGAQAPDHKFSWHDSIHKPIAGGRNPCGFNAANPCDDDRHGTHTMGTMVGNDGKGSITGMAPEAQWVACHNMDQGVGRPTTYLECFEFFLAPYPAGGNPARDGRSDLAPHVMNNSWGCPTSEGCQGKEFGPALEALQKAGMMVVVSAGNEGSACKTIGDQPATWTDSTFSVGAMDHRTGTIASFSSRGPSVLDGGAGPDVAAPGVSVLSTVPGGRYESTDWSGTSMAGPHVAGLVALMWSANPALVGKVEETAAIIRKTADPKTSSQNCGGLRGQDVPNNVYGYGNINAFKAVQAALRHR